MLNVEGLYEVSDNDPENDVWVAFINFKQKDGISRFDDIIEVRSGRKIELMIRVSAILKALNNLKYAD